MSAPDPHAAGPVVTWADDVCALALARRMAAMLDRDPATLRTGDALPHGWHALMFNLPTRQSQLRPDGTLDLGVPLPDLGLPRLMLAGRQNRFLGAIPIGAAVHRESRTYAPRLKTGRSGRFALVRVEHRITVAGSRDVAVEETLEYVLREAAAPQGASTTAPDAAASSSAAASATTPGTAAPAAAAAAPPQATRPLLPDERLLLRYSGITDNPHRIHYDLPYAREQEGYPDLVVNGSLPAMFLLELFRATAGREPRSLTSRNVAPMYCNRPLRLCLREDEPQHWHLWAEDAAGRVTFDAHAT